jgi:hypothetical protein
MENYSTNAVAKINKLSISSVVAGLLSIIVYLPPLMALATAFSSNVWNTLANAIPTLVYGIGGIFLGAIGLSLSASALREIKNNNVRNRSHAVALTGRILSILGILTNILIFRGMLSQ